MLAAAFAAFAFPIAASPAYAVVQQFDLSEPMSLHAPWIATIQAPTNRDAQTGDTPVRVCFTGLHEGRTDCEAIEAGGYPYQTFVDAKIETLLASRRVRALVVRADYSGGSDSSRQVEMWACTAVGCNQTFTVGFSDIGEDERFASGPLAGDYVTADFVLTRKNETRWDSHRFSIRVYRLDPSYDGYLQVLQYVTEDTYPAEREAKHSIVDAETQTIGRRLHDIYPNGPPP